MMRDLWECLLGYLDYAPDGLVWCVLEGDALSEELIADVVGSGKIFILTGGETVGDELLLFGG